MNHNNTNRGLRILTPATLLLVVLALATGNASATLALSLDTTISNGSTFTANGSGGITYSAISMSPVLLASTLVASGTYGSNGPTTSECPNCSPQLTQTYATNVWNGFTSSSSPFTPSLLAYDTYAGSQSINQYVQGLLSYTDYWPNSNADYSLVQWVGVSQNYGSTCSTTALANGNNRYDCNGFSYFSQWVANQSNPSFIAAAGDVSTWTESQFAAWLSSEGSLSFFESAADYEYSYECSASNCGSTYYNRYNGAQYSGIARINVVNVPEPAALALVGLGLIGLVMTRRRKQ